MKKLIYWEKWLDPLGKNIDEIQWPDWDDIPSESDIKASAAIEDEFGEERPLGEPMVMEQGEGFRGLVTAQGLIPLSEVQWGSKLFNFWVGHTNFRITEADVAAIQDVDGVEIWSQFTPYRFRIAVARLFNSSEVKYKIAEAINNVHNENPLGSNLG